MWTTLSKLREFKRNERMTRAQLEILAQKLVENVKFDVVTVDELP